MGLNMREAGEEKSGDRFQWALEILRIRPEDNILEIGCGTGRLAGLIAECLDSGRITAIDRSGPMIAKARGLVPESKVRFLAGELGKVNLPAGHFSKAVAFNVSGFWMADAPRHLEILRSHLCPGGEFFLFHQPPISLKTKAVAEKSRFNLEAAGFSVKKVIFEDLKPALASCIVSMSVYSPRQG